MSGKREQVADFQRLDAARHEMLINLLDQITVLTKERDDAKTELEMARDSSKHYYQRMLEEQARSQGTPEGDRFVLVLIDGDSMPFADDFVKKGSDGGDEISKRLRAAVTKYCTDLQMNPRDVKILLRVYANVRSLGKVLAVQNVISSEGVFLDFVDGFTKSHAMSDFLDVGNRKEAADSKMKANFELFHSNPNCIHILFGGSSDNSYAGFLSPFAPATGENSRVTLVESIPFAWDLRNVSRRFRCTSFKDLFRPSKLESRPALHNIVTTASMSRPVSQIHAANSEGTVVAGIKRTADSAPTPVLPIVKRTLSSSGAIYSTTPHSEQANRSPASSFPQAESKMPRFIYQNGNGQRVDTRIPAIDNAYLDELYDTRSPYNLTKLCNNYYLRGACKYGDKCSFNHRERLTPLQVDTLRYKARSSACNDPKCMDPECVLGHMCPRGPGCTFQPCKFKGPMHHIDMRDLYLYDVDHRQRRAVESNDPF